MSLTYNQFEVLAYLERNQDKRTTQRQLAALLDVSLGVINKTLNELLESEMIRLRKNSCYDVILKGYEVLEPYRVKKAIFLAAGFGSRMVPITLNTPKPLVLVHGKRIIDTLLDAVVAAGIEDIIIVRGYLGEQFEVLLHKYPNIKFIDNPLYNETNNISSAYLIKDQMERAYVLESDLLLYNPAVIRKYEYATNYCGIEKSLTDDWCFFMKKGYISRLAVGGENCYQMVGISYWNEEDGRKMAKDIEYVFSMPGGKEKYWDEVALRECIANHKVMVKSVKDEDIVEIDTFKELKQIDSIYNV